VKGGIYFNFVVGLWVRGIPGTSGTSGDIRGIVLNTVDTSGLLRKAGNMDTGFGVTTLSRFFNARAGKFLNK